MYVAGTQKMPVVLSRIRLAAVARGCRTVTSESDEVLAKHRARASGRTYAQTILEIVELARARYAGPPAR
jgi:hypothetical protein